MILCYDRSAAVAYARRWALGRNPAYFDFSGIGGDCTNFASQCLYAGAPVMNFTPVMGWFYRTAGDRTASWTGVEFLYNFLVANTGPGPFAHEVPRRLALPGDLVQLGNMQGRFTHTPVILSVTPQILVAAHSVDALDRPLDSYQYHTARFLRIDGARRN